MDSAHHERGDPDGTVRDRAVDRLAELEQNPVVRLTDALRLPEGEERNQRLVELANDEASTDPRRSLEALSYVAGDDELGDRALVSVAEATASDHPDEAITALREVSDDELRDSTFVSVAEAMAPNHPDEALTALGEVGDDELRDKALVSVAEATASDHPRAAVQAVRNLSDHDTKNMAAALVGEELADRWPNQTRAALFLIEDDPDLENEARHRVALKMAPVDRTTAVVIADGMVVRDKLDRYERESLKERVNRIAQEARQDRHRGDR